jgi:hypothetical protein
MASQPDTRVVFRHGGGIGNLTAVVRADDGVVDVQLRAGRWWCSAGDGPGCTHIGAVDDALALAPGGKP